MTTLVIFAFVAILNIIEVVTEFEGDKTDLVAVLVYSITNDPFLVFAAGVLFGHLFWSGL